jgi:predicted GNAT family acetyltransferase
MNASHSNIVHNEAEQRFELADGGSTAVAQYRLEGEQISFTHTVVPPEMEGKGVGSQLVQTALDEARKRGLKVVPLCYFVKGYIERHPEYQDLLA